MPREFIGRRGGLSTHYWQSHPERPDGWFWETNLDRSDPDFDARVARIKADYGDVFVGETAYDARGEVLTGCVPVFRKNQYANQ